MVTRFNFPLETVLKLRKQKEDQQKHVVAQRLREMSTLRDKLMSLNEQIAMELRKTRDNAVHAHLDLPDLSRRRIWVSHLQRGVLEKEFRLRKMEEQLTRDRDALAAASKERRVLEKLRETRRKEYDRKLGGAELQEADELAICRYIQSQHSEGE